jgi:hypothetical protein
MEAQHWEPPPDEVRLHVAGDFREVTQGRNCSLTNLTRRFHLRRSRTDSHIIL